MERLVYHTILEQATHLLGEVAVVDSVPASTGFDLELCGNEAADVSGSKTGACIGLTCGREREQDG